MTGHSYIVYGPLNNGITGMLYEGDPTSPRIDRHWEIVERYKVTQYYTAPDADPRLHQGRREEPQRHDLSSLQPARHGRRADQPGGLDLVLEVHRRRALPDRGHLVADGERRILITPLPGVTALKPGSATVPFPGNRRDPGRARRRGRTRQGGFLVMTAPVAGYVPHALPGRRALRRELLPGTAPAVYFAGDGAKQDEDGYYWLLGRIDDVMNVSGHRLSHDRDRVCAGAHPSRGRGRGGGADRTSTPGQTIARLRAA